MASCRSLAVLWPSQRPNRDGDGAACEELATDDASVARPWSNCESMEGLEAAKIRVSWSCDRSPSGVSDSAVGG